MMCLSAVTGHSQDVFLQFITHFFNLPHKLTIRIQLDSFSHLHFLPAKPSGIDRQLCNKKIIGVFASA
jgi:hypothetical protein